MRRIVVAVIALAIALGLLALTVATVTHLFALRASFAPGMSALLAVLATLTALFVTLALVFWRKRQPGEDD